MNSYRMLFGYGLVMAVVFTMPFIRPGAAILRGNAGAPMASAAYASSPLPNWLDPVAAPADSGKSQADPPAEKVFKNIVIFKGKPASQLLGAMRFINMSLGVSCDFCHVHEDFSSDEKPAKLTTRSMYYMMERINNQNFSSMSVNCYTCHAGQRRPLVAPPGTADSVLAFADSTHAKLAGETPAEKAYKNIVIFKGKPAGQLPGAMHFITTSLGVTCGFCHVRGDFASDELPAKSTARSMYYMMERINDQNFSAVSVTCFTCHGGRRRPLISPVLTDDRPGMPLGQAGAVKPGTSGSLTLENVLALNTKALGGEAAIDQIRSLQIEGKEVHADGRASTFQASLKAPDKLLFVTDVEKPTKGRSVQAFNGVSGWMRFNEGEPRDLMAESAEQVRRLAEAIPGANLKKLYPDLDVWGRDSSADGHGYMVLGGTSANGTRERLYFDAATGLLVRRYVEYQTLFGYIPFTIDYADYKPVNGVQIPTTIRWQTTRDKWTDTYTSVRANVAVDDALFTKPQVDRPKK